MATTTKATTRDAALAVTVSKGSRTLGQTEGEGEDYLSLQKLNSRMKDLSKVNAHEIQSK